MYVIILGCGAIGTRFAYSQLAAGHEVLMIDKEPAQVERVESSLGSIATLGDATLSATLADTGILRADAFVATTGDDAANLASCQLAKFEFNVKHVISIVNDSYNTELFLATGVDKIISRTDIILANLAGTLLEHPMAELMLINDRNEKLVAMKVPRSAHSVGKKIGDLPLPYGIIIPLVISRLGAPFVPDEETILLGGEEIVASCPSESLDELAYVLTGLSFAATVS